MFNDDYSDEVGMPARTKTIAIIKELVYAADVSLGHITGGMDGTWLDLQPEDTLRGAIKRGKDYLERLNEKV